MRKRSAIARVELPAGYLFRHPRREDAEGILELMKAVDQAELGETDSSIDDVLEIWGLPRFEMARDAWIVEGPDKKIAAYAWAWDRKPHAEIQADSYVLPGLGFPGVEEPLLDRLEERAREHQAAAPRTETVRLRLFTSPNASDRAALYTAHGFERVRTYWRMTIDLRAGFAEPRWPTGIEPRVYRTGEDATVTERAIQESFAGHFAHTHEPHEEWVQRRVGHPNFDPNLWTLAWDGAEVAGAVLSYLLDDEGWVRELGVRPAWRGRGLGRALLLHSFGQFEKRGCSKAGLGVDAANATGATQLYESVGMRVAFRHDLYEKSFGAGRGA